MVGIFYYFLQRKYHKQLIKLKEDYNERENKSRNPSGIFTDKTGYRNDQGTVATEVTRTVEPEPIPEPVRSDEERTTIPNDVDSEPTGISEVSSGDNTGNEKTASPIKKFLNSLKKDDGRTESKN